MKQRWVGQHLHNLLTLTIDELVALYPHTSREALRRTRRKYKTKARKVTSMEQNSPNPESEKLAKVFQDAGIDLSSNDLDSATSVGFHVGFIRNADGEIEYTKPLPNVRFNGSEKHKLEDFISQADPVKITPSRRKPPVRDHDVIVVFSDTQIDYMDIHGTGELSPIHDEAYIKCVRLICQDYQPEYIIDTSDTVDFSALSRFPKDSNRFNVSLNHAINRAHQMYAELRADNPKANIKAVDSNHTRRLAKFMMKNAPELFGIRQAGNDSLYPALSYPFLLNLEALGVEWYGGYGAAAYIHGEEYGKPPIVFKHGETSVNNGSTAAKESAANPETHVVRGHSHRAELYHRTNRAGEYLTSMVIGCGCHTNGVVPSYHSAVDDNGVPVHYQENWSQSVGLIFDYKDGTYDFNHIMVNKGIGKYNGKVYDGTSA